MEFLTPDEVLAIHYRVAQDFAQTEDPVGDAGPRDDGALLESAVARQYTGFGNKLKHPDPYSNAATLTFGLCCNHPFRNGNKRTALVAMLAHLERNGHTLFDTRQRELYTMIKAVANHSLGVREDPRKRKRDIDGYSKREADEEVAAIARWLRANARKTDRGERHITYRQLRQLIARHGFEMDNPKNGSIGVYRDVEVKRGLLKTKTRIEKKRIGVIGYPGDKRVVPLKELRKARRMCGLDESHGCDSGTFYEGTDLADAFIVKYYKILEKLARE